MATGTCSVCCENDTSTQIKACCKHLVFVCDDCSYMRRVIAHEKCTPCSKGKLTPEQEEENIHEHIGWFDDCFDEEERDMCADTADPDPYDLRLLDRWDD